ncbi:molybdopterin molybdotransferase MoeA [Cyanobium sp. NIES-981]|uniref:molybdopterin molybdotransferase MoeA n=1 Tax=Cyanobium sp. NIES-981 TaxID=1851505 RepID=UPI0007DCDA87|nr:molybdopterin molybdotransferase MoeA [Cyanobium sp. NIES-981]SBO44159.1 Molybdenum cofactor biosynthesis protein MoeA [Cyanobium sp. NIES-981]
MGEPFPPEGLALEEARRQVLSGLEPLAGEETLPLDAALGRVTAAALLASETVPGFRASIMDGYALGGDGAIPAEGSRWRLVGRAAPGAPFGRALLPGEAVRILTGAPVPGGSARVLPQELVLLEQGDALRLQRPVGPNPWIRAADEEAEPGQVLCEAGRRLGPADLARLASCGVPLVPVRRRPRIGVLISGDELTPVGEPRRPGAIWESNGTLLQALLARLGYGVAQRLVVADTPEALRAALEQLASACDVVVSTGGVSAGDSDWIRPLVAELGTVAFWKLFLKPGRPFAFGQVRDRPFFGLPGNPVAAAVTALQLLWPALQRLEGAQVQLLPRLPVQLAAPLQRPAGRPELARARLEVGPAGELLARLDGTQASSRIGSLQGADLLLELPAACASLEAGATVWAQWLRLPIF